MEKGKEKIWNPPNFEGSSGKKVQDGEAAEKWLSSTLEDERKESDTDGLAKATPEEPTKNDKPQLATEESEVVRPKYRRLVDLTNKNLKDIILPHKAFETRQLLELGNHIKISREGIVLKYDHHALVSSTPCILPDGRVKINLIEFSVPGKNKFKGVIRERTIFLTNENMVEMNIRRVDGHYDMEPEEKWSKDEKKVIQRARERVKCKCLLCICNVGETCVCGKPEQKCQDKDAHYETYSVASKNCEHFVLSLFGENRSIQAEQRGLTTLVKCCCVMRGREGFEEEQFVSTGSDAPDADDRQETLAS